MSNVIEFRPPAKCHVCGATPTKAAQAHTSAGLRVVCENGSECAERVNAERYPPGPPPKVG